MNFRPPLGRCTARELPAKSRRIERRGKVDLTPVFSEHVAKCSIPEVLLEAWHQSISESIPNSGSSSTAATMASGTTNPPAFVTM
jgi:hypothetical protein